MKENDLVKRIAETPRFFAVFRLVNIPHWLQSDWKKGDLIWASIDHMGYLDGISASGNRISIKSSFVEFVGYKSSEDISREFGVPKNTLALSFR